MKLNALPSCDATWFIKKLKKTQTQTQKGLREPRVLYFLYLYL